jgi:hypothetical protein
VTWPTPAPGLVIRYAYLWEHEARAGQEEGVKDRPCAIILALHDDNERMRVYVLPITHSPPVEAGNAVEIPQATKRRLGLDDARSWIVLTELNAFVWPGPDLRPLPGHDPKSVAYGFLPPAFFRRVRDGFLAVDKRRKAAIVRRTE